MNLEFVYDLLYIGARNFTGPTGASCARFDRSQFFFSAFPKVQSIADIRIIIFIPVRSVISFIIFFMPTAPIQTPDLQTVLSQRLSLQGRCLLHL